MKRLFRHSPWLLLLLALSFVACDDDDGDAYPNLVTELVEVRTGADKNVTSITTDAGEVFAPSSAISANIADTLYRCLCSYVLKGDGTATVYELSRVMSARPYPPAAFSVRPMDPVSIISHWQSPRWLNVRFSYLTGGGSNHQFAFCEDSTATTASGNAVHHISLLHKRPDDDPENYTTKQYLSLPLWRFADGDSVVLTINTPDGLTQIACSN